MYVFLKKNPNIFASDCPPTPFLGEKWRKTKQLIHCSPSIFYRYFFGRCSSELAQLVPLPFSRGRSTCYSDRWHDFSVTIYRCYKDVYLNIFFPCTAKLWNFVPIERFPLTYNIDGFKSSINRHLLAVGSL